MDLVFWICLGLIAYTYLLYPAAIILLSKVKPSFPEPEAEHIPRVAMLVAAYNEEQILEEKIANCLALRYPRDRIRFVFGSDGSTDRTNQILTNQIQDRIQFKIYNDREGKSSVLNKLVSEVDEEIVLFSDANSIYKADALEKLIPYFADSAVGGVCGKLTLINPEGNPGGEGEGLYWSYENLIKRAEGSLCSVISANGAIIAIRRELFEPLPLQRIVNDDFSITLAVLRKKQRVVYEPKAQAIEYTSPNMEGEFLRKIRISSLNFNALPEILPLLHPRYGCIAVFLFSHKIIRWMVPILGMGFLISNVILLGSGIIYSGAIILQAIVYIGALLGLLGDMLFKNSGPFIPFYYLAMINVALVVGFWRSLSGRQGGAWRKVPR